jgi:hypothetical protein
MKIRIGKGHIWVDFDNGLVLSIVNGSGTYTDNYENYLKVDTLLPYFESKNVEIAILDKKGKFCTKKILNSDDDVIGYVSLEELFEIITKIKEYKK